jgi:hypothetical protein
MVNYNPKKGDKVPVRLSDGRVVEAEYDCVHARRSKTHWVIFNGHSYLASEKAPDDWAGARFVGKPCVLEPICKIK